MVKRDVVVGVDGGGTRTRVLVTNRSGAVLGSAEGSGASPQHNLRAAARETVHDVIGQALTEAGRAPDEVAALTAGLAGLNNESDLEWATSFVALEGLGCEPVCVNDAIVGHAGALLGDPGVVAICGTGSIVVAITDEGRVIRNYDFDHQTHATARTFGRRAAHALLAGHVCPEDDPLVDRLLGHWDVDSVAALRRTMLETDRFATDHADNPFDTAAPLVTGAAASGTPLAVSVCERAVEGVLTGVRCVGGSLEERPVPVAPVGSVLGSEYVRELLREQLEADDDYRLADPAMNPVAGAVFLGLQRLAGEEDGFRREGEHGDDFEAAIQRLETSPTTQP